MAIASNQTFLEPARIKKPRILDPTLTSSLWTLMFTLPTLMAAVTINLAYESRYGFLVDFALLNMVAIYGGSVLTGILIGLPLFWTLERFNLQFGFLYMIAGFLVYGLLFVYMNIELHTGLYDRLSAEHGNVFENYLRGIQAFRFLWPGFAFLGMAIALTGWARLLRN
jgi:hypothetical protein